MPIAYGFRLNGFSCAFTQTEHGVGLLPTKEKAELILKLETHAAKRNSVNLNLTLVSFSLEKDGSIRCDDYDYNELRQFMKENPLSSEGWNEELFKREMKALAYEVEANQYAESRYGVPVSTLYKQSSEIRSAHEEQIALSLIHI